MTFRDLEIKTIYDSDEDDILNNFYIPVLSNAVRYNRMAGYFSSTSFAATASGMSDFIQNGGKMKLITCVQFTKQDYDAIIDGTSNPEKIISKTLLTKLSMVTTLQEDHVAALAWMVANKNLEIKIAVPYRNNEPITEDLGPNSIYHQKVGILFDEENNVITFSGSQNETASAWTSNIEQCKAYRSWMPYEDTYGSHDARMFEKFWYGNPKRTKIYRLPDAVENHLIKLSPESVEQATRGIRRSKPTNIILRKYQKNAVQSWLTNGKHGIFEMATGTGKTIAAIACIKEILSSTKAHTLVVIACPYINLITQWSNALDEWNIKSELAHGNSKAWSRELFESIYDLNIGVTNKLVIVTTHLTFSNPKFVDLVKLCKADKFVITDEVHKVGARKIAQGLLSEYNYRLGLSATPKRYFDDEGSKLILEFFGDVVFKFELDDAIRNGYLTPYRLFPHIIYLTPEETSKYSDFSRKIAISASQDPPDDELVKNLLVQRSKIIKNAANKLAELKKILREHRDLTHCLIYCASKQMSSIKSILYDAGVTFHPFTFKESRDKREKLLEEFTDGEQNFLVAMRCLDEGVDVPATQTAIIMASSHNPAEFIQRRGRVLRPFEGKKYADIHDMIAIPSLQSTDDVLADSVKKIIRKEFERLGEFAKSSHNPEYSKELIQKFVTLYDLGGATN